AAAKVAMSAGVKPAAIVNYENYVTHPVAYGPPKNPAKPAGKGGVKAASHRPPVKPRGKSALAHKSGGSHSARAVVIPAATKKPIADSAKASTQTPVAISPPPAKTLKPIPSTSTPVPSVSGQKKPSAGIPKEASQN